MLFVPQWAKIVVVVVEPYLEVVVVPFLLSVTAELGTEQIRAYIITMESICIFILGELKAYPF